MSKINWTDKTWNPIIGCKKYGSGCKNCYAEKMAVRLAGIKATKEKYQNVVSNGSWNGKTYLHEPDLSKKFKRNEIIFVCSMADIFHNLHYHKIDRVFCVIENNPETYFIILTKRPALAFRYFSNPIAIDFSKNIWFGMTVCEQINANFNIPYFLELNAPVKFISCEPLLGKIDLNNGIVDHGGYLKNGSDISLLDWVIVGCENGRNRRPCKIEWIESIVSQCQTADVPVFVKQMEINGKVTSDINEFPKHLQLREMPKLYANTTI